MLEVAQAKVTSQQDRDRGTVMRGRLGMMVLGGTYKLPNGTLQAQI